MSGSSTQVSRVTIITHLRKMVFKNDFKKSAAPAPADSGPPRCDVCAVEIDVGNDPTWTLVSVITYGQRLSTV